MYHPLVITLPTKSYKIFPEIFIIDIEIIGKNIIYSQYIVMRFDF